MADVDAERWRNRVVGSGFMHPAEIELHDLNWRRHPEEQRRALLGALAEVGWVQPVVVNRRNGRLVDGHLRVLLAREEGADAVPVTFVDLDDNEERLALATLDAIAKLAISDDAALVSLLEQVEVEDEDLLGFLDALVPEDDEAYLADPVMPERPNLDASPQLAALEYRIVVDCADEEEQTRLLSRFDEEGIKCRALIS